VNEGHFHAFAIVDILDVPEVEGEEGDFGRMITNGLYFIVGKIPCPPRSFDFLDEPSKLTKFVYATLHNVLILMHKNHLNLRVSSLASLPFPFDLIDSANV
jgi:hypothetical protein